MDGNGLGSSEPDTFWRDFLGSTATFCTICQFLSGMFTVHRIVSKQSGSVGDLSPVPFIMGSIGCALWLIYGYLRGDGIVVNCNIVGTVLNSFYVAVFIRFTMNKSLIYRQVSCALILVAVVLLYVYNDVSGAVVIPNDSGVVRNIGLTCIVVGLLGCASPLVALKDVIRTKPTETLPFPLIFSMFLVCSLWWGYGVLTGDAYMQFTNFLGSCIALMQLGLFCVYDNKTKGGEYKKFHSSI